MPTLIKRRINVYAMLNELAQRYNIPKEVWAEVLKRHTTETRITVPAPAVAASSIKGE